MVGESFNAAQNYYFLKMRDVRECSALRDDEAVGLWLISSVGNVLVRSVFRFRFDTKLFLVLQIVWTK